MRRKNLLYTLLTLGMLTAFSWCASGQEDVWKDALDLYRSGQYERARTLFESLGDNFSGNGYAALCALRMKADDSFATAEKFIKENPQSPVVPGINFEMADILFDEGKYSAAAAMFDKIPFRYVGKSKRSEYLYKRGHCAFIAEKYPEAKTFFLKLEQEPESDYNAPGRYALGYMCYTEKDFQKAESWFKLSVKDPRFKDISEFYIVDCEFMNGNYAYAISEGERIYPDSPEERKPHLARIISESYLVKGNSSKAFEFYGKGAMSVEDVTRSDYFYAGTVLYEVEDYAGAIENYLKMTNRSDSLGQVANYHLANSYIKTKNKVAAMGAFKDASLAGYDSTIAEDAFFNYAKLAFDLNQDPSVFESYLKKYGTKTRGEQIYTYMALSALYRRNYQEAIEAYDRIDELDADMRGNYAKANYLRASQLVASGSYSDAVPYFKATSFYLDKQDRLSQLSKFWLGESYYQSEKYADAATVLSELYNASALDGMAEGKLLSYDIAYAYFNSGDYTQASKWFDTYIRSKAGDNREDALTRRADCDFAQKDYKAAVGSYANVLNEYRSANSIYPYYRQALAYGLSGDPKQKAQTLKQVLDADPASPMYAEAMYELGRAYSDLKDNAEAVRIFNTLKSSARDNSYVAKALIGLGMVYRNARDYESALSSYKEVVSLMPDTGYAKDALTAIESIYQKQRHPEKYLAYVESLGLNSGKTEAENAEMYFGTAEQLYLNSNWEQAAGLLDQYIATYPSAGKMHEAHFYLAECYKALGRKEKACDEYQTSIDLDPKGAYSEQALAASADLNFSIERYAKAYELYRNLLACGKFEANKLAAKIGMMRSAFNAKDYESAIKSVAVVSIMKGISKDLRREADFIKAKSLLSSSYRDEAFVIFRQLAAEPSTDEGAQACYLVIQDTFDKGDFASVDAKVYDFAAKAPNQSYWLARAYVVLGDSFIERENYSQAKATFESLKEGYKAVDQNDEVPQTVEARLARIQTLISK